MPFTRHSIHFQNEIEYNEWVMDETELIIMNTEELYLRYKSCYRNTIDLPMYLLVDEVMATNGFKRKRKNVVALTKRLMSTKEYL